MNCNNCGTPVPNGNGFCTACGAPAPAQQPTMICQACGSPIGNGESFCRTCGAPAPVAPQVAFCQACGAPLMAGHPVCVRCGAPVANGGAKPYSEEQASGIASSALTFGILGVIFACFGFLSFLGIIFSAIAISKAKKYKMMTGTYLGKAGVGRGLGIGGLITGIFITSIFVLVFGIAFLAAF